MAIILKRLKIGRFQQSIVTNFQNYLYLPLHFKPLIFIFTALKTTTQQHEHS